MGTFKNLEGLDNSEKICREFNESTELREFLELRESRNYRQVRESMEFKSSII